MIINENGHGDKKEAPVTKEEVKEVKDVRKAKLQKDTKDAEQK